MRKTKYLCLVPLIGLLLSSCNLGSSNPSVIGTPIVVAGTGTVTASVVRLTVQATNAGDTFNAPGQAINYQYTVTNTGVVPLTGNAIVSDNRVTVNCPDTTTVGNLDNVLDPNESVICTSTYPITQADLTAGSVISVASANVGGFSSNQVSTTVTFGAAQISGLKLMKTASPLTFSAAGQSITYTYVIQNMGTAPVGPTQFMISDDKIGAPFACGAASTTLAPQQTINCSANYAVVQADVTAGRVINTATASGGGANVSAPATTTVTLSTVTGPTPNPNFTRGSTITHTVAKDEWMIQLARCYGVTFESVRAANPQVIDPDVIDVDERLTIPNIGSNGTIYGPPCIDHYTVQSGDTWASIAQKFNADVVVLQAANRRGMAVGTVLLIPRNSAGSSIPVTGITSIPTLTPTITLTPNIIITPTFTPTPTGTLPTPTGTLATPTPMTPAPTNTITIPAQATPVTFPAGGSATSIQCTLPAQGSVSYALPASQGQILAINVTAPSTEVSVSVTDPNGTPILPLSPSSFTWNVTLAATGNYYITITAIAGAQPKPYTLAIGLATPTPTSTRQP